MIKERGPSYQECDRFCEPLSFSEEDLQPGLDEFMDSLQEKDKLASGVDKLFGYPCWVQDTEYPFYPENNCGHEMDMLIFQFDAQILGYMFGDAGLCSDFGTERLRYSEYTVFGLIVVF